MQELKEINNLGLIAGLMSLGYSPIDRQKRNRIVFYVFENNEEVEDLCRQYYNNRLEVDAQTYYITLKSVKSTIYKM